MRESTPKGGGRGTTGGTGQLVRCHGRCHHQRQAAGPVGGGRGRRGRPPVPTPPPPRLPQADGAGWRPTPFPGEEIGRPVRRRQPPEGSTGRRCTPPHPSPALTQQAPPPLASARSTTAAAAPTPCSPTTCTTPQPHHQKEIKTYHAALIVIHLASCKGVALARDAEARSSDGVKGLGREEGSEGLGLLGQDGVAGGARPRGAVVAHNRCR